MLGLTLAHRLAQQGRPVTVLEAAPTLGGLASAWSLPVEGEARSSGTGTTTSRCCPTRARVASSRELGLDDEIEWVKTQDRLLQRRSASRPVSNTVEFLRLPGARIWSTSCGSARTILLRVARHRLAQARADRRRDLAARLVRAAARSGGSGCRCCGRSSATRYTDTSAAFIWATIQRLYAARRSGLKKEMFGYVPGGYARVLERFGDRPPRRRCRQLELRGAREHGRVGRRTASRSTRSTAAIDDVRRRRRHRATPRSRRRLCPGLTAGRAAAARADPLPGHRLRVARAAPPLAGYYLTYITDDVPFTRSIEMTALVDPRRVRRPHARVPAEVRRVPTTRCSRPTTTRSRARSCRRCSGMYPSLVDDDVLGVRVSRVRARLRRSRRSATRAGCRR